MSKQRARSILRTKVLLKNSVIMEIKVWEVPKDKRYPEGYKYSLFAIHDGRVLVGYDNHYPKGHHRHIGEQETSYDFSTLQKLRNDFKADLEVQMAKKGLL